MGQLQKIEDQLVDLGYQILAVNPDRPAKLGDAITKNDLKYQVLSDSTMECSRAFGLAFRVDDETLKRYKGYGIDLEEASGQDHHLLPVPAVYIVGKDAKIRFQYVNPDYRIRLDSDTLLAAAKASIAK